MASCFFWCGGFEAAKNSTARRTASGFHLHQGCAGLRQANPEQTKRQAPEVCAKTSEDEKSFAVEVMQR